VRFIEGAALQDTVQDALKKFKQGIYGQARSDGSAGSSTGQGQSLDGALPVVVAAWAVAQGDEGWPAVGGVWAVETVKEEEWEVAVPDNFNRWHPLHYEIGFPRSFGDLRLYP